MTQFSRVIHIWCSTLSTWHLYGNRVSKTRFTSKIKTKKTTTTTAKTTAKKTTKYVFIREEKKKKNPETRVAVRERRSRAATWAAWRPGSGAAWSCVAGSASLHLHFFFFFSFSLFFLSFCVFVVSTFWVINNNYFWIRNWALETRFPCRCHMEKVPHQTWTTHENQVSKTRFIDPKLSSLDSRC